MYYIYTWLCYMHTPIISLLIVYIYNSISHHTNSNIGNPRCKPNKSLTITSPEMDGRNTSYSFILSHMDPYGWLMLVISQPTPNVPIASLMFHQLPMNMPIPHTTPFLVPDISMADRPATGARRAATHMACCRRVVAALLAVVGVT